MLLEVILFIGVLILLMLIGVPVPFAIGATCVIIMVSPLAPFQPGFAAQGITSGADSFVLLAIPLFLMTGLYMNMFDITEVIFDFAGALVGPVRGGIAHVNVMASMLFSGMSGAATADAAGLGAIEYEAMQNENYKKGFSAAVTGASSIIGPIIPPSIPLIVYGILAEESVGALFIAGIVPGVMMGLSLFVICTYYAHRHGYERGTWWSPKKIVSTFVHALPALGTPILIIGGILAGFFTATEAGTVALVYTIIVGFVFYGGVDWDTFVETTYEGVLITAAITFIVAVAALYALLIRRVQLHRMIGDFLGGLTGSTVFLLLVIVVVLLLVGTFLETIAAITIFVPILHPIIVQMGIDPIHFGIVLTMALMIGLLTPPLGLVLFILERITDITLEQIFKSIIPFYVPLMIVLLLVVVYPETSLWLPRAVGLV